MGSQDFQRNRVSAPAVPAANGTVVLFDSTKVLNKLGLSTVGVGRVQMSFPGLDQDSAAGGLIGYSSPDKGTTWYQFQFGGSVLPATVEKATATDFTSYDIFVGTEEDVKFELTVGGTAPTVWHPQIFYQVGNVHSGT